MHLIAAGGAYLYTRDEYDALILCCLRSVLQPQQGIMVGYRNDVQSMRMGAQDKFLRAQYAIRCGGMQMQVGPPRAPPARMENLLHA